MVRIKPFILLVVLICILPITNIILVISTSFREYSLYKSNLVSSQEIVHKNQISQEFKYTTDLLTDTLKNDFLQSIQDLDSKVISYEYYKSWEDDSFILTSHEVKITGAFANILNVIHRLEFELQHFKLICVEMDKSYDYTKKSYKLKALMIIQTLNKK